MRPGSAFDRTCASAALRPSANEKLYYTNDANMNVTALVDGSDGSVVERYAYDPYGKPHFMDASFGSRSSSSYANEILYCGYRFDPETGLYSVRYRYYLYNLGRWGSRDMEGYVGCASLYIYVAGSPMGFLDPLGKHHIDGNFIVVGEGDTMWEIAKTETGAGANYTQLDPPPSGDYNQVYPGDRIPITSEFDESRRKHKGNGDDRRLGARADALQSDPGCRIKGPEEEGDWLAKAKELAPPLEDPAKVVAQTMDLIEKTYGPEECEAPLDVRLVLRITAKRGVVNLISMGIRGVHDAATNTPAPDPLSPPSSEDAAADLIVKGIGAALKHIAGGEEKEGNVDQAAKAFTEWALSNRWLDLTVNECVCASCKQCKTTESEQIMYPRDNSWKWYDQYEITTYTYQQNKECGPSGHE